MKTQKILKLGLRLLIALMMIVCILGGLVLINEGMENLLRVKGQDRAIPGDEVGELFVQSTRDVIINRESLLWIVLGLGLVGGSLYAGRGLQQRVLQRGQTE